MSLRNFEKTYLYKETFQVSRIFLREIFFRKYVKSESRENKNVLCTNISGHLIRKISTFWQIVDDPGVAVCTDWCCHSKECVSVQCLEATIKNVRETDKKTPLAESILKYLNFTENCLHSSRFPANFLKVFRKRRTAVL